MEFSLPLVPGTLLRRYKRFLADVRLDSGEEITAHCPNPGSMLGLAEPGLPVWLSKSDDPKRKLAYGLELVDPGSGLVGVNTNRANALVAEALDAWVIPGLTGYASIRREVKYGANSRIDFLMTSDIGPVCYLEVKSVTLKRDRADPGLGEFPDAVTKRGAKHLDELATVAARGDRAVLLYLVQRSDCAAVTVAADIDPGYAEAIVRAAGAGVEIKAVACRLSPTEIAADRVIPYRPPA
jgi:sugar fermentation stimulation protein A